MRFVSGLLGFAVFLGGVGVAEAGLISSIVGSTSLPGTATVGPIGGNPSPNNDNAAAASPNTFSYSVFWNAVTSGEVEFAVSNSGGATEYFISQNLFNLTGQTWTGYRYELGFGRGSSFVAASGALDFDLPNADPAPTSSRFAVLTHQPQSLEWSGGTTPDLVAAAFTFSIDVPDNLAALNPGGTNAFTLRQTPIVASAVPEPATALLMVGALLAVGVLHRRR